MAVQKVELGRSGLRVTRVGMGGIPIQRLSTAQAVAVVQHCLDQGVNFIDTARVYSNSEERIGKALSGRRDGVIVASKSQARDRAGFLADVDHSLQQLQMDRIDLYQLHNVSKDAEYEQVVASGGALEGAQQAREAGKILHIGLTSHSPDIAKRAVLSGLFETIMFPLNFVAREPGEELYPLAKQKDVGFIVMKPFGGGMLDNARLVFRYLAQFPKAVAIPGIESKREIDEILRIVSQPAELGEGERAEMERIRAEVGNRFCRRCDYCQPCPQGVPVSELMTAESVLKRMPLGRFVSYLAGPVEKAVMACEKCGQCEERCPYGLPIQEMMDESIALYLREKARYESNTSGA